MIWCLLACSAPPDDSGTVADPVDTADSGAWPPESVQPTWSLDEAGEALQQAMGNGIAESFTLRNWFLTLIMDEEVEDESCYTVESTTDGDLYSGWWEGTCEGAGGYLFNGGWLYQQTEKIEGESEELTVSMLGSFEGTSAEGVTDSVGGTLLISRISPTPSEHEFSIDAGGLWHAPAESGWLGAGVGLGLSIDGTLSNGEMTMSVEGGTAYGDDLYVYFSGLSFDEASCGRAPMGDVWLRDPSGAWIIFAFGETCDGCAQVSIGEELLGESCVGDSVWAAASLALMAINNG